MHLTNHRNGPIFVRLSNGKSRLVPQGESVDADPFTYTQDHPFIRAGWVTVANGMYGITKLLPMGASIIDYTFDQNDDETELMALLAQAGATQIKDIVQGANVPGYNMSDIENALDDWLDLGDRQRSTLVVLHAPGNSISSREPYPTDAQVIRDGMERICQRILDAGYSLLLLPLSYRVPEDGRGRETAAWNRNIHWPLIRQYCPDFWDQDTGRPVFDWWQWTYDRRDLIMDDHVHPNDAMRNYLRGRFARKVSDVLNPSHRVTAQQLSGRTVLISFGRQFEGFDGINAAIYNNEPSASTSTEGAAFCTRLFDSEGNALNGLHLFGQGWSGTNASGDPSKGRAGVTDIDNATAVGQSAYISHDGIAEVGIYGLPDGMYGTLSITATRSAGTTRKAEFWQEDKRFDSVVVDARASELDVQSLRFETLNGRIMVNWAKTPESDYGYMGVIKIKFD